MLGVGTHQLQEDSVSISNETHKNAILEAMQNKDLLGVSLNTLEAPSKIKNTLKVAQSTLNERAESMDFGNGNEWDYKIGNWKIEEYTLALVKSSSNGPIKSNPWMWVALTFGLGILGGLLFIIPKFLRPPGIKHDGIYHNSLTRGLKLTPRIIVLTVTIFGILVWGFVKLSNLFWPLITMVVGGLIIYLVMVKQDSKKHVPQRSASPKVTGWIGLIAGICFITFYILLYWFPSYITNWTTMLNPLSKMLNGGEASQWFLYGLMYTVIVIVMGIRMLSKYLHNKYQRIRTYSVMFFQTAFAFLIPEILVRLNKPYMDFKNIWPLNYDFFFSYKLDELTSSGTLGIFMLVWGIALIVIAVPVITYFYGKRWYCSWVCGCGGLAETMGDPFRQLSDKSLRAWKFERFIIHGVLVLAVIMTAMVLYTYFSGNYTIAFINSDSLKSWYGFLIGAGFAGVVGTGFYPLMGNRTWCRFGCPLAAYLGLVQRFKSKFRITTNGGQCISCGNCSTYCEMGIDVRWYAQRGQDIVRSSCVGCGVCSAVCPRGVLRLENGPEQGRLLMDEV